jgi:hypothetical protein
MKPQHGLEMDMRIHQFGCNSEGRSWLKNLPCQQRTLICSNGGLTLSRRKLCKKPELFSTILQGLKFVHTLPQNCIWRGCSRLEIHDQVAAHDTTIRSQRLPSPSFILPKRRLHLWKTKSSIPEFGALDVRDINDIYLTTSFC